MQTITTALQPTGDGTPHLGNYLGLIAPLLRLQAAGHPSHVFVADLHATTSSRHSYEASLRMAAYLLACGVDRSTVYLQSSVRSHSELALLLLHVSTFTELQRMRQFHDKSQRPEFQGARSIPTGLLTYPTLMAADILLYDTDLVPCGADQVQHLELTRTLARRVNKMAGTSLFRLPQAALSDTPRILSLSDSAPIPAKMSKSDPKGCLLLSECNAGIASKVMKAPMDTRYGLDDRRPPSSATRNMLAIHSALSGQSETDVITAFAGRGYRTFREDIIRRLQDHLGPIRQRASLILQDRETLEANLTSNALVRSAQAELKMQDVRAVFGLARKAA